MACPTRLSLWTREVSMAFAHLSKPQIWGLVLWSAGIAWSGCAGIVQISALLAMVLGQQEQSVFQRLREWYLDAETKGGKRGKKRRELEVSLCFAPLLRWVLQLWQSEQKHLALVMDATTLGERWTILAISVVLSGCAIPVAWKVLPGKGEGSWRPHWEGLLKHLEGAVPDEWQVLVLADRGLYARWMWDAIRACGWHPFLRLNLGIKARAVGEETFEWVSRWVPRPGTSWKGRVECFAGKHSRVKGTLLLHWEAGYESAWIVLTDLRARGGPDQLVWVAHLDRNGVQRFQTGPLGLAPDENDACQLCRTALAGDGRGAGLVSEFGLPGRGTPGAALAAARARRVVAQSAYRASEAHSSCWSAARSPLELCRARTAGAAGPALSSRAVSAGASATGRVARNHHPAQETARALRGAQAAASAGKGAATRAETPNADTHQRSEMSRPKNLYL